MNRKRFTPQPIIGMLREAEVALFENARPLFAPNELLSTNTYRM